jgi:hypothetical protein
MEGDMTDLAPRGKRQDRSWVGRRISGEELQSRILGAQEQIMNDPAGFKEDELERLGRAASISITQAYGFNQRWQQAAGTMDAGALSKKRIQELSRSDPALRAAFDRAAANGAPEEALVRQMSLLRSLEQRSGISATTLSSPIAKMLGGVNTDDLGATMRAIHEDEALIARKIATMKDPATKRRVLTTVGARGGIGGTPGRTIESYESMSLDLNPESVQRLFQNDVIRQGLSATISGTPAERQAAVAQLVQMTTSTSSDLSRDDAHALSRMVGVSQRNSQEGREMQGLIRAMLDDRALESSLAVKRRERELGREMSQGIQADRWRFEGQEAGYAKLEQIAALRQQGKIVEAMKAEQELMASGIGKSEGFQKAVAGVRSLGYMTQQMGRMQELEKRYKGGRGGSGLTHLIEDAFSSVGVELTQDRGRRKEIERAVQAGDWAGLSRLGVAQTAIDQMRKEGTFARGALDIAVGGVKGDEVRAASALRASREAAQARLEGAAEEVSASSALQKEQLNIMKLQLKAQLQIATQAGKLDAATVAAITNATKENGEEGTP